MALEKPARMYSKLRRAFARNFMDSLCNIWRFRGYANDNEGGSGNWGEFPAYSEVLCRVRSSTDGHDQKTPGLTEFEGTITLPISYLGLIQTNDRIEITTLGTNVLPESMTFAIIDTPRPIASGMSCRVKKVHGEASNG